MHEIGLNKKKTHVHVKSDLHKTQGCTKLEYQHICHTDTVVPGSLTFKWVSKISKIIIINPTKILLGLNVQLSIVSIPDNFVIVCTSIMHINNTTQSVN